MPNITSRLGQYCIVRHVDDHLSVTFTLTFPIIKRTAGDPPEWTEMTFAGQISLVWWVPQRLAI